MTNEDKNLLFKDLCARLAYGVKLQWLDEIVDLWSISIAHNQTSVSFKNKIDPYAHDEIYCGYQGCTITLAPECIKPYLRPFSRMTEEEAEESLQLLQDIHNKPRSSTVLKYIEWLNEHYFDYHDLIKKGLAIEAPEGMYDI